MFLDWYCKVNARFLPLGPMAILWKMSLPLWKKYGTDIIKFDKKHLKKV